jgi:hypothetical protein
MDIVAAVGLAKTSLDLIRGVREALKNKTLSKQEMTDYLSDLQDKIVDIKTALVGTGGRIQVHRAFIWSKRHQAWRIEQDFSLAALPQHQTGR